MPEAMIPDVREEFTTTPHPAAPDAHGQAALLLAESILHALIETNSLTVDQAISIVRTASEVKMDAAAEIGEPNERMEQSLRLLARIEGSMRTVEGATAKE